MRKILFVTMAMLCLIGAQAQTKSGAIKVDVGALAFGFAQASYEMPFSEKTSGQLALGLVPDGFGVTPEFRIYSKEAIKGFNFGPVASYASVSSGGVSASAFGVGGKFGWNWFLGSSENVVIDLGLGAMYYSASGSGSGTSITLNGVLPVVNLAVGYAF
jgi:hypothetical protein